MSENATGQLWSTDGRIGFTMVREYPVTIEQLWTAVTTPEQLERWLNPVSGDLREGGSYQIDFGEGDAGGGEIRGCDRPHEFVVTYMHENEPDSLLRVQLEAPDDAAGTRLTMNQDGLPSDQAAGVAAGWHAFLDSLGAVLTGQPRPDWDARWQELVGGYRAQYETLP